MDIELKTKWVEALRSGGYRQTAGTLRDTKGFCCLGVLCEVAGYEPTQGERYLDNRGKIIGGYFTERQADDIGISMHIQHVAAGMNDEGKSFTEIADYIEENL